VDDRKNSIWAAIILNMFVAVPMMQQDGGQNIWSINAKKDLLVNCPPFALLFHWFSTIVR
jgi:hypothetical protein